MSGSFDTLKATHELEAAGMERPQAEVVAAYLQLVAAAGHEQALRRLVTLEARMTWRVVGLVIAANALLVGAVVALVKLLP